MSRNLDPSLQAALPNGLISPAVLAALTFKSGIMYAWSGVGDLVYAGNTYKGVGMLGKVSPVQEGTDVKADGMTVMLSGIQLAALVNNPPPAGLTPPTTPPAGTYIAWAAPTRASAVEGPGGGTTATLSGGRVVLDYISGLGEQSAEAIWSGFIPPSLPADAVITGIYPVCVASSVVSGIPGILGSSFGLPGGTFSSAQFSGISLGTTEAAITSASVNVSLTGGENGVQQTVNVTAVALAIYYTSASNAVSALNEALADIQLGAPAKIYFALLSTGNGTLAVTGSTTSGSNSVPVSSTAGIAVGMSISGAGIPGGTTVTAVGSGTLTLSANATATATGVALTVGPVPYGTVLGAPYLIFSGQIDQPTVDIDTETISITLALENRLTNLARPSSRRYTAADQHIAYPDDIGFNWVEALNDIAERWGT